LISKNAKAVQEPFSSGKRKRILLAETFSVEFDKENQSLAKYNASGRARYSEDDRNATANQIIFTETDGVVRLRGGEPTIWDSKARAKAIEIDWDTRNDKSFLRQKVSSTYYNQSQSDGTLPFSDSSAPVYITAEAAEFDHKNETGIYSGNVRAWQEENYIRADRIILFAKERKMNAEGRVQTLLYKVKQRVINGKEVDQPVFVSSDRFSYLDETRVIRYEGNVDIKQGSDRINSDSAEIFLNKQNELIRAIVSGNVKISQPNRRGTGEYAEYVAASEVIILRGSPAKVEDAEQGELQGAQMTLYMRENRFIGEGKEKTLSSPGRTRSIYKVKN
jgi:lipopolysaccharide transport protein LptA